jgi:hypothetical protein
MVDRAATTPTDLAFDPKVLADDLNEVRRIYADFFDQLDTATWDRPAPHGHNEWGLHESIAHLYALNGDGLESIKHTLRGEPYTFRGLDSRYQFNAYARDGIDEHLGAPLDALCAEFLRIHDEAAGIARTLRPDQAEIAAAMPIYNRPVQIVEALGIMVMHAGLIHSAQVAEPAGVPPLWMQLSPDIRHRMIARVMRAFSLLYRRDIGGPLRAPVVFRVGGPGGGEWRVELSPEGTVSSEGAAESPRLIVELRETDDFCRMITGRLNLPVALLEGRFRPHGDLRLFVRMGKLFSIDARP